jgi:hypothetical protein
MVDQIYGICKCTSVYTSIEDRRQDERHASRDDTVVDTTTHPAMAKAKKRNAIAIMANLTMAFTSEMTMGLVYKAQTEEWPGGLGALGRSGIKGKIYA